jgi:hypothetical protein
MDFCALLEGYYCACFFSVAYVSSAKNRGLVEASVSESAFDDATRFTLQ